MCVFRGVLGREEGWCKCMLIAALDFHTAGRNVFILELAFTILDLELKSDSTVAVGYLLRVMKERMYQKEWKTTDL